MRSPHLKKLLKKGVRWLSSQIVETVVKAYARKYGISEDRAREILAPILAKRDKVEEMAKLLNELQTVAGVLGEMPDEIRPMASTMIMKEFIGDEDDLKSIIREARKMALQLKMIDTILKTTLGEPVAQQQQQQNIESNPLIEQLRRENEELRRQNEELRARIEELLKRFEEEERKRKEEEVRRRLIILRKKLRNIEENIMKSIEELKNRPVQQGPPPEDQLEQLSRLINNYTKIHNAIVKLSNLVAGKPVPEVPKESSEGGKIDWVEVLRLLRDIATSRHPFPEQPRPGGIIPTTVTAAPKPVAKAKPRIEEEFKPLPENIGGEEKEVESKAIVVGGSSKSSEEGEE